MMGNIKVKGLCEYGCGKEAKYQFKNGKRCCSKYITQCLEVRNKNRISNIGKKMPLEVKERNRIAHLGKKPWNKGKRGVQVAWNKEKSLIETHGEKKAKEIKRKIGNHKKNKTYEEIYGKEKADKLRKSLKEFMEGKTYIKLHGEEKAEKLKKEHAERMRGKNNPMFEIGKNHPNWRGGCTKEGYCEEWRTKDLKEHVLDRDYYKCQNLQCENKSDRLCVHHINYNKKDCDPWNLITTCFSCNSIANYNREWWNSYYQEIIRRKGIYKDLR